MLLHLYSYYATGSDSKHPVKLGDEERPMANGHARVPNPTNRQAQDAQEFELEGLMSDDEEADAKAGLANGRPH